MRKIGYLPGTPALSSLVWHKESKTLYVAWSYMKPEFGLMSYGYFIGFRDRDVGQPKGPIVDVKWIAMYGLAIPNSNAWLQQGWNHDTTDWKW